MPRCKISIFALTPILKRYREGDGSHILRQQMAIGVGKAVGHLVKTYAGIETYTEILLNTSAFGIATSLSNSLA